MEVKFKLAPITYLHAVLGKIVKVKHLHYTVKWELNYEAPIQIDNIYVFGSVDDQDFHWECGQFCIICQGLLLHDRQIHLCTLIHFKHKLSNEGFNKQLCIEQGVEQIILTCHIHKFPEKININISLLFKLPVT